jgi:AcrR family transcriptional regulator
MVDPKEPDRRVRRTKKLLRDALVSLILERGWDEVTVQDVCARADVGRSTFYVHFADKEDALFSGFDDLHAALANLSREGTPFSFVLPLVEHALENVRVFRAIVGRKSGAKMQAGFFRVVHQLVTADLTTLGVASEEHERLSRFLSGGFVELLLNFLDRPNKVEPTTVASSYVRFANAAMATCRRIAPSASTAAFTPKHAPRRRP